jgi:hypothetical protein
MHLQVWNGPLIFGSLKSRFQVFENIWILLVQFFLKKFPTLNIDVVNIVI